MRRSMLFTCAMRNRSSCEFQWSSTHGRSAKANQPADKVFAELADDERFVGLGKRMEQELFELQKRLSEE